MAITGSKAMGRTIRSGSGSRPGSRSRSHSCSHSRSPGASRALDLESSLFEL